MFTCYQCGKLIRAKMVRTNPSILHCQLGLDFPKPYHPACYEKAEREAARILKQKAADWQEKTRAYRISIGLETR
jgi:hypothetical protein